MDELKRKEADLDHTLVTFEGDRQGWVDLLVEKDLYALTYKHQMISNTFLMLYSHLEEYLYLIWQVYGNSIELGGKRNGSISRFTPIVKSALNIDLSKDKKWQFVIEAEIIRNCLLHANARIDLSKHKEKLYSLVQKRKQLLYEENSRLVVKEGYVEEFFGCVQYIVSRVESSAKTDQPHELT